MQPAAGQPAAGPQAFPPPGIADGSVPPLLLGLLPPPPPPPASHLNAYPPPIGSIGPAQLLGQAQSAAQVSPQCTHSPATMQLLCSNGPVLHTGSGNVAIGFSHPVPTAAGAYPTDPSTAGTQFSHMSLGVLPISPERTGKPPKTVDELRVILTHWLRNQPELQQDGHRQAYEDYVMTTIMFGKDYGLPVALTYHLEVIRAMMHKPFPLYDPCMHGPIYYAAYHSLVEGKSKVGTAARTFRRGGTGTAAANAPDPPSTGKKRKAPASSDAKDACSVPGHMGHTNAECRWQKQQKQPAGKKTTAPAAAAAAADSADG